MIHEDIKCHVWLECDCGQQAHAEAYGTNMEYFQAEERAAENWDEMMEPEE
jgi:hypothetical protein